MRAEGSSLILREGQESADHVIHAFVPVLHKDIRRGQAAFATAAENQKVLVLRELGKTPSGIRFEGDSPRLLVTNYANIPLDIGADIPVVFCIPANGYVSAPIAKDSTANRTFAERTASAQHGLSFAVAKDSPFFGQKDMHELTQTLVDWAYNEAAFAIDTASVAFAPSSKAAFSYLPVDGATKSKIVVDLKAAIGTKIVFR